ncbi:MAG TPA: MFS transporter [Pseudohaliea sp.]|nr:MFS transporter [Pseudohaliea sp.]
MALGAVLLREPATGAAATASAAGTLTAGQAMRTRAFYLLWGMLCLNVTAGIGVISQAAPMLQEMFPASVTPGVAATLIGVLSVANMVGRFGWSAVSDRLGRRATFTTFFALGIGMYLAIPTLGAGSLWLTMICLVVILSMYGGGFATMPAYVKDVFGMANLGAIYGRVLTAWSVAGVLGPVLVSSLREIQLARGVPPIQAYSVTLLVMAGLLAAGLVCSRLMRPESSDGPRG